jgi:hypothetical protein
MTIAAMAVCAVGRETASEAGGGAAGGAGSEGGVRARGRRAGQVGSEGDGRMVGRRALMNVAATHWPRPPRIHLHRCRLMAVSGELYS